MTDKKFKCNKCGKNDYLFPIKGSNNTKLCYQCGRNVCSKCGKKEIVKRWIEDEDCCGNTIMREAEVDGFFQREKEGNNLENSWNVFYCSEHKKETQKNSNKWTEEDDKIWYERQQQEERERIAREKREREEKLNKQKNLFYAEYYYGEDKNGEKYNIFRGKNNGEDYYLVVPVKHPIWKSTDPDTEKVVSGLYHEAFYLVLIDGVENIPIEKSPVGYWKWTDKTINFHKIVAVSDKITIAEADENQENDEPTKNKPDNNQEKDKNTPIPGSVKEYFRRNNLKTIKLAGSKWIIEYNDNGQINEYLVSGTTMSEFLELKDYFSKANKNTLTRQELDLDINSDTVSTTKPKNNALWVWIGCGIIGEAVIITVIIGLLLRRKKRIKKG